MESIILTSTTTTKKTMAPTSSYAHDIIDEQIKTLEEFRPLFFLDGKEC